jgi:hypothetical protein
MTPDDALPLKRFQRKPRHNTGLTDAEWNRRYEEIVLKRKAEALADLQRCDRVAVPDSFLQRWSGVGSSLREFSGSGRAEE